MSKGCLLKIMETWLSTGIFALVIVCCYLKCSSETGHNDTGSTTFQTFIVLTTCIKQQDSACKASPSIIHDPLRKKDLNI